MATHDKQPYSITWNRSINLNPYLEASNQMAREANEYADNLRRLYPELSTWSLDNLYKFHESGDVTIVNGKPIYSANYNPVKSVVSSDTKTEEQHDLGEQRAKALRDTKQGMEKAQTSIVSTLPFAYPLLATGANQYLNRYGFKNQYLPEAVISTGLEFTFPFVPGVLKKGFNWGMRNIGTRSSRLAATINQNLDNNIQFPFINNYTRNYQINRGNLVSQSSFDFDWDNEIYNPDNFTSIDGILTKNDHIQKGKDIIGKYGTPELNTVSFQGGQEYPVVMTILDQNSHFILPASKYFDTQIKPRFKNFGINVDNPFNNNTLIYAHEMPYYTVKDGVANMHYGNATLGGGASDDIALVYTRSPNPENSWIHEGASHLTDQYIPKIIQDDYQYIATIPDKLKQKRFKFIDSNSGMWEEARATLNEVRSKMLKDGVDLNTVSDDTILEYLQDINSYGRDYTRIARYLLGNEKSEYIDRIRKTLITLPAATGVFSISEKYKKGGKLISKIHIKDKNKGKFTESAKRAGYSVQEYAKHVLNDPNATPLQKKRANFARNSKQWLKN